MNYLPLFMYTHEAATVNSWKCYPNLLWRLEQTHLGSAFWRQWEVAWLSTFWLYDSRWCIYLPNSVSSSVRWGHQSRCSGIWHGASWRRVGGHPWRLDELEALPFSQKSPTAGIKPFTISPFSRSCPFPPAWGESPVAMSPLLSWTSWLDQAGHMTSVFPVTMSLLLGIGNWDCKVASLPRILFHRGYLGWKQQMTTNHA